MSTNLSRCYLTYETSSCSLCIAIAPQSESLDMCVSCGAIFARVALDFADLHHGEGGSWRVISI